MSRLFISHSSQNDDWAIALRNWLLREGWTGPDDIFLDLDPDRGIAAGERWARAFADAATRCEAVLFVVSEGWLKSKWCTDEYQLASSRNKRLFALLIEDIGFERLPGGMGAQWQIVQLRGEPAERFVIEHPRTGQLSPVHISEAGLKSLKRGLEKSGIGPETFELQPDPNGPLGWRAPYRGLEALEPEDAAVFFGRSADIVRGIEALRGIAGRKPPRLLAILGASGTGKSSFLRAGLWPRLARDDSQWLPLRVLRAGRGGAIEGSEGLLSALEEVHRRFALPVSRASLRERLTKPESFVALIGELRQAAARRALLSNSQPPVPVLCLDQAEEVFASDVGAESARLLELLRAAIDHAEAVLLITIRSDASSLMQGAPAFTGIHPELLSLGPVPPGEIARIIREPNEILRRKVGPAAPALDAAVVEHLQSEIEGESDALPLLAFVLQRLTREHTGAKIIGVKELDQTGGVAAAIESAAEGAFSDVGYSQDRTERRQILRRLFIPRLAGINRDSKIPQRRVARQADLPADLQRLARELTNRRLLVVKLARQAAGIATPDTATLEVAHEALLRRWPTLADLLANDRDALLLLDGVLLAANDWEKAGDRQSDFLAHRGSRLADAQALASRGPDWEREIAPARQYLAACQARETAERKDKEVALAREQRRIARERLLLRLAVVMLGLATVAAGIAVWVFFGIIQSQNSALNQTRTMAASLLEAIGQEEISTSIAAEMLHTAHSAEQELKKASMVDVKPVLVLLHTFASDVQSTLGNGKQALTSAQQAEALANELVKSDPQNDDNRQALFDSAIRIASALMDYRHDPKPALDKYQDVQKLAEQTRSQRPCNLATLNIRMGDALLLTDQKNRFQDAFDRFNGARPFAEQCANTDHAKMQWRLLPAVLRTKLANLQTQRLPPKDPGLSSVLQDIEAVIADELKLINADSSGTVAKHNLAITTLARANVLASLGRYGRKPEPGVDSNAIGALVDYTTSIAALEGLKDRDPNNVHWLIELAAAQRQFGVALETTNDFESAFQIFEKEIVNRDALVKKDASNERWQWDLKASHDKQQYILSQHPEFKSTAGQRDQEPALHNVR